MRRRDSRHTQSNRFQLFSSARARSDLRSALATVADAFASTAV